MRGGESGKSRREVALRRWVQESCASGECGIGRFEVVDCSSVFSE